MSPQMTALFPKFCDVPQDKLEENEEFRFHAKQVVETVALAVSILDDIPELVCALEDLGRVHSHLKVEGHHFKVRVFAAARLAEIDFFGFVILCTSGCRGSAGVDHAARTGRQANQQHARGLDKLLRDSDGQNVRWTEGRTCAGKPSRS